MIEDPSCSAGLPGHAPDHFVRSDERRGHRGLIGVVGAAANRDLEHPVDQARPLVGGEAVGLGEESDLMCAILRGRQPAQHGHVVAVELAVEADCLGDLVEPVHWPGEVPVDESYRLAVASDDVPRSHVTVPDHRVFAWAVGIPGHPHSVRWGEEGAGGIMEFAKEPGDLNDGVIGPGVGVN